MKRNSEKGATGMDIVGGLIIFILASGAVISIYYQIYVTTVMTKVHQIAAGCITEIFEKIDFEDYDDITDDRIKTMIEESKMNEYFKEDKNRSHVEYSLINYAEETGVDEDILKKITITVVYNVGGNEVTFPMSKIKIREQKYEERKRNNLNSTYNVYNYVFSYNWITSNFKQLYI